MAGLSTGYMRDQNDANYAHPKPGTGLSRPGNIPAGIGLTGSGCNGNCPGGIGANDSVNVRLEIRIPTNTASFSYALRFFSAEYWTFACSSYNDFHWHEQPLVIPYP